MRRLLLGSAAGLACLTSVQAADLGNPRGAAIAAPADLWTGFYAGAHAGWGFGRVTYDPLLWIFDRTTLFNGALVGGQFGWNYQGGPFVVGLEGSLAYSAMSGSFVPIANNIVRNKMNWLATMGPRLGFAYDRALVYAKGGLAVAGFQGGVSAAPGPDLSGPYARGGWFLGAGVEYAFAPNWSVRLEYNYINFGNGSAMLQALPPLGVGVSAPANVQTVTLGVNYRFGGGTVAAPAAGGAVPIWTGFYAGGHLGYGTGQVAFAPAVGAPTTRFGGALGGAQFGWNYQINQIVLGLEGTATYAGLRGQSVNGTLVTGLDWLVTMGPRVGFAFDRALVYAKGGFAMAGLRSGLIGGGSTPGATSRSGWFLGGGAEYAFAPNWSARLDYSYVNLRSDWTTLLSNATVSNQVQAKADAHVVTLGLNYLFSTGPSAVVARY